jgi:hypothetical protein
MLPKRQIREWLASLIIPVSGGLGEKREVISHQRLSLVTLARHFQLDPQNLWNVARGNRAVNIGLQRRLTRFIPEWEGGYWRIERKNNAKVLVANENPVPLKQFKVNMFDASLSKVVNQPLQGEMPRYLWRK